MNFLASLFEQSVNSYRSAFSSAHEKVDGVTTLLHISRMMKDTLIKGHHSLSMIPCGR